PGESPASRDPRPPRAGRDVGHGPRRTVRHEPSGGFETPQGAGARRPDRAGPRGAMAAMPAAGRAAQGRGRLHRELPPVLGAESRPAAGLPARAAGQGGQAEEARSPEVAAKTKEDSQMGREADVMDQAVALTPTARS